MSRRLAILGRAVLGGPLRPVVKLRLLNELALVTAEGFGTERPEWAGESFAPRLTEYAEFTAREAERLLAAGDDVATAAVRDRLRAGSTKLGDSLRRTLGLRDVDEAFAALKLLYRQIEIELGGGPVGEVTVGRCFFSAYYSEPACRVIEALDQGLVTGLFNGASFEFSERLTAGAPRCRACIRAGEAQA